MSAADIVRVHSTATLAPAVFPAFALAPYFANPTDNARREDDCAAIFAEANGWLLRDHWPREFAGLPFSKVYALVDHAQFFEAPDGSNVVAIVSHDYHPSRDFSALGEYIVVERLPRSWYRRGVPMGEPEATTAYLLRPSGAKPAPKHDPAISAALTRLMARDTACIHGAA
jgi:hypothetical protein